MKRFLLGAITLGSIGGILLAVTVYGTNEPPGNQGQVYRLPWKDGETSYRSEYGLSKAVTVLELVGLGKTG